MRQTQTSRAASWLPVMIRLTAVGYLLFFVPDLVFASTHHVSGLPPFTVQVEPPGAPEQVKVIGPAKLLFELSVRL